MIMIVTAPGSQADLLLLSMDKTATPYRALDMRLISFKNGCVERTNQVSASRSHGTTIDVF